MSPSITRLLDYSTTQFMSPLLLALASVLVLTARANATEATTPPCAPKPLATAVADTPSSDDAATATFTIGSLNMHADPKTVESLEQWTRERSIDVLLLQEVGDEREDGAVMMTELSR